MAARNRLLDLVFAMDCTISMCPYMRDAIRKICAIVDAFGSEDAITVRFALIEYRDHPPEANEFVTRVHNFTNEKAEMKEWLHGCIALGGGDTAEAVADALNDALNLPWNSEAVKICILISDALPHGVVRIGDSYPDGCPCGHDPTRIVEQMAKKNITLYTVGIEVEPPIREHRGYFEELTRKAGGEYVSIADANRLAQTIIAGVCERSIEAKPIIDRKQLVITRPALRRTLSLSALPAPLYPALLAPTYPALLAPTYPALLAPTYPALLAPTYPALLASPYPALPAPLRPDGRT